jgi:hypothetical protein
MIWLSILFLCVAQAAEVGPALDIPEASGVYYRQGDSSWIHLQPAVTEDAGASGLQLFVYTGGYTDLAMHISCPGPRAAVRIAVPKPTLYIRAVGSAKDAMLIRLTKRKDKRVYKTSFSNVTVGNKGGFRKRDIFYLISHAYPDGSFSVSPEKDLPPGEYLLILGNAVPVYDFGVDRGNW